MHYSSESSNWERWCSQDLLICNYKSFLPYLWVGESAWWCRKLIFTLFSPPFLLYEDSKVELLRIAGTSWDHLVKLPCSHRITWSPRIVSSQVVNVSIDKNCYFSEPMAVLGQEVEKRYQVEHSFRWDQTELHWAHLKVSCQTCLLLPSFA